MPQPGKARINCTATFDDIETTVPSTVVLGNVMSAKKLTIPPLGVGANMTRLTFTLAVIVTLAVG